MLPGPTAPSEGFAGVRDLDLPARRPKNPSSILAHQLRRRFPSRRSKRPGSLFGSAPERASPPNSPPHGPKASATLMFRGPSWAGSLLRGLSPWGGNRLSQKRAPALPAPLADWSGNPFAASSPRRTVQPRTSFHRLPAEIGPSVTLRFLLAVAGLPGRRGLPSRSRIEPAQRIRVAPSGK